MIAWQGTITNRSGGSLGTVDEVARMLEQAFPGLRFTWTTTGAEKLRAIEASGVAVPDIVRDTLRLQPAYFCGSVEIGAVALSFNVGTGGPVETVWATVEGPDAPCRSILAQLVAMAGFRLEAPEAIRVEYLVPGESPAPPQGATLYRRTPEIERDPDEG